MCIRVVNHDAEIMNHMAASGSNGLFLHSGSPGRMRPWSVAQLELDKSPFEVSLFEGIDKETREFRLYLPLYKALKSLELGLCHGARILRPSPTALNKPLVFYGTSITQGGCASTAGSDFVSTIGRRLNLDTVNLGFSGSGRGEPEIARLITEIDAALYVLDYAANVDTAHLLRTLPRFVDILRDQRPDTPILLITNLCYSGYDFCVPTRQSLEEKRGGQHLHIVDGFSLVPFGTDTAYVDGIHPADHGFYLISERLAPFIEQIIVRDDLTPTHE